MRAYRCDQLQCWIGPSGSLLNAIQCIPDACFVITSLPLPSFFARFKVLAHASVTGIQKVEYDGTYRKSDKGLCEKHEVPLRPFVVDDLINVSEARADNRECNNTSNEQFHARSVVSGQWSSRAMPVVCDAISLDVYNRVWFPFINSTDPESGPATIAIFKAEDTRETHKQNLDVRHGISERDKKAVFAALVDLDSKYDVVMYEAWDQGAFEFHLVYCDGS